jgi:hypothetical protein
MGVDKGEIKNKSSKKGFLNGSNSNTTESSWNWGDVETGELSGLVELVTSRGGAIRFGYSRDGNAGSIGVYYGEDRDTVYLRPGTAFQDGIKPIESFFRDKPFTGGKQPKS